MKKSKILLILIALALTLSLASCKEKTAVVETAEPPESEAVETKPLYEETLINNWQEYTLTFPEGTSDEVSSAFYNFTAALVEKYGSMPKANSDFLMPGDTIPENTLEVLVGATNRPESAQGAEGLLANDYFIGMINNRLVIVGGSDKATAAAINHYTSHLLGDEGFMYPAEGYVYKSDYLVDKLTIGGVDISEYVIIRGSGMSAGDRMLVDHMRDIISDICGVSLNIEVPSSKEKTNEILIGNTGRALTSVELEKGTYSILQSDGKIALYGNGTSSEAFVLKQFILNVLLKIPESDSYDLKLENIIGEEFIAPSLVSSNLPDTLGDFSGKYDDSVASAETTMDRFFLSVDELPEEITVVSPIVLEDYLSTSRNQIYVSAANGDDDNIGTKNAPFKTINKAVAAMKNASGGVIWVEGDTYELSETITVGAAHSGTVIAPLFIKSYGEKEATLTSNVIIEASGFRLVDTEKDKVAARLHDDVEGKVYCINLYDDLGWSERDIVDVTTAGTGRLYVDGEEFTLARFPNAYYDDGVTPIESGDLLYFNYVYDTGSVSTTDCLNYWPWIERTNSDPNLTPDSILGWEIRIPDAKGATVPEEAFMGEEIKSWVNTGNIWYYGNIYAGWEHGYYNIAPDCVHGDNLLGSLKQDGLYSLKSVNPCAYGARVSGNSASGRNTYYLFNAIEALDVPGEWFIDKETGYLYIYPKSDDITKQQVTYSGTKTLNALLNIEGANYVVVDGVGVDGCNNYGIRVGNSENVVLQYITTKNTGNASVRFENSKKSALINSSLSYSYTDMLQVGSEPDEYNLVPTDVFIQNNVFFNTPPSVSAAMYIGACRVVVSHNKFIDCCYTGSGCETIIEYNIFEGGNRFITDGGMVYISGLNTRGHHIRYNLFHMFKATHQAVYFDTMGSGMYAYGNVISTLGAWTNSHKAWYSSSGHGNVCYANIIVLRNAAQIDSVDGKDTDEQSEAIRKGDDINESRLFYYYYGDGNEKNDEAAHWWMDMKAAEIQRRFVRSDEEAWRARYPDYMNSLLGDKIILAAYGYADYAVYYKPQKLSGKTLTYTEAKDGEAVFVPEYEYLDGNGTKKVMPEKRVTAQGGQGITLTFDDIAAMERLTRQPAFSVIRNNIILGGSTNRNNIITSYAASSEGIIKDVTIKSDNFFEFYYDKIMVDAENGDYRITDEAWARIESEIGVNKAAVLKEIDYTRAGTTYDK